jgi:hypothetical protein
MDGFDSYRLTDLSSTNGWNGTPFGYPPGRISGSAVNIIADNDIWMSISPAIVGFAFKNETGDPGIFGTAGEIFFAINGMPTCGDPRNVCPGSPYIVDFKVGIGLDAANRPFVYTTGWSDDGVCPGHPDKCDRWVPFDTSFYGWGETPALNHDEWNYLEINLQTLELRLNGGTIVTSGSTITSHGTLYSASGIDDSRVYLKVPALLNSIWFDDFYAQDAGGGFVGDVHIETVYPDADGHYTDWTPGPGGAGPDHYTRVDEVTMDGNHSYNLSLTPGDRDTYLMQPLSFSSGTIFATQLNLAVSLGNGLHEASAQASIRQAGTDHDGSGITLSAFDETGSGYWRASFVSDTDPLGSPWTVPTVNGDEYGILLDSVVPA